MLDGDGGGAGRVDFTNATLGDLVVNSTGPVSAGGPIDLSGTLTRTAAGDLAMGRETRLRTYAVGGLLTAGALSSTGTVTLDGGGAQAVDFTNGTLGDLVVNSTGPVTAGGPIDLSGTLTRTAGDLGMGGERLGVCERRRGLHRRRAERARGR